MADGSRGSHETCCRDGDGDGNDSLYGGCMPCTPHPKGSESMKPGSNESKMRNILKNQTFMCSVRVTYQRVVQQEKYNVS